MRSKWLSYLAPVPAMVMLFTMLYQSFHKMEHVAECHESHSCCNIPYNVPVSTPNTTLSDYQFSQSEDFSPCIICEYEFTFCSEIVKANFYTSSILPPSEIPQIKAQYHNRFNGLHEQLRAPPAL